MDFDEHVLLEAAGFHAEAGGAHQRHEVVEEGLSDFGRGSVGE